VDHLLSELTARIVLLIVMLPFRIFWWAIKHDLGLLDEPPMAASKPPVPPHAPTPPTLWDRELDGSGLGSPGVPWSDPDLDDGVGATRCA
jgi:hypothetical protein